MSTSLSLQLRKLAAPQTGLLMQDKKRASLLFDPKEAANMDRETVYAIGLNGLQELCDLDPRFRAFEQTLFSESSIRLERSVQTREENARLDSEVESFLRLLAPLVLLRPAQQALEWVVRRFHPHLFNADALLLTLLPFHHTKLFARVLGLLGGHIRQPTGRWTWLKSLQKAVVPLPTATLLAHCSSQPAFLQMLGQSAFLRDPVGTAFFVSVSLGAMENVGPRRGLPEEHLSVLLPFVKTGLRSEETQAVSGAYMMIGMIARKACHGGAARGLSPQVVRHLVKDLIRHTPPPGLETMKVLLLVLLMQCYKGAGELVFTTKLVEESTKCPGLANHVGTLSENDIWVLPLLMPWIAALLHHGRLNFVIRLIKQTRLPPRDAQQLVLRILESYEPKASQGVSRSKKQGQLQRSAFQTLLDRLSCKYPEAYEAAVKEVLGRVGGEGKEEGLRRLRGILGLLAPGEEGQEEEDGEPVTELSVGSLCQKIYHTDAYTRAQAVRMLLASHRNNAPQLDGSFVSEALSARLKDEDSGVVEAVLMAPWSQLSSIMPEEDLLAQLSCLVLGDAPEESSRGSTSNTWRGLRVKAATLMCSAPGLMAPGAGRTADVLLTTLHAVMPSRAKDKDLALAVLRSPFAQCNPILKRTLDRLGPVDEKTPHERICALSFEGCRDGVGRLSPAQRHALSEHLLALGQSLQSPLSRPVLQQTTALLLLSWLLHHQHRKGEKTLSLASGLLEMVRRAYSNVGGKVARAVKDQGGNYQPLSPGNVGRCWKTAFGGCLPLQVVTYALNEVVSCLPSSPPENKSWPNSSPELFGVLTSIFELSSEGAQAAGKGQHLFRAVLKSLVQEQLGSLQRQTHFLSALWLGTDIVQPKIQLRALLVGQALFQGVEGGGPKSWLLGLPCRVVPCLLVALSSPLQAVRMASLRCVKDLSTLVGAHLQKESNYLPLLQMVLKRTQEVEMDPNSLKDLLERFLSTAGKEQPATLIEQALLECVVSADSPTALSLGLLRALEQHPSTRILPRIQPLASRLLSSEPRLSAAESSLLHHVAQRLDHTTCPWLGTQEGWGLFSALLFSPCPPTAVAALERVQRRWFQEMSLQPQLRRKVLATLLKTCTCTRSVEVARAAHGALKRLPLDAGDAAQELLTLEDAARALATRKADTAAKRRRRVLSQDVEFSSALLETEAWRRTVALLETLQEKKKLREPLALLPVLYRLLRHCLGVESPSAALEYALQLLLGCVHRCASGPPALPPGANPIEVELIVRCLRTSLNPQTHHQALLVLARAAQLHPQGLLLHLLPLFTFVGSSLLRQDDSYTFQVICRTVESVLPVLAASGTSGESGVTKGAWEVLSVFASALRDVPAHRRSGLFQHLLDTLGPRDHLWCFLVHVFRAHVTQAAHLPVASAQEKLQGAGGDKDLALEFAQGLMQEWSPQLQMQACLRVLQYVQKKATQKEESPPALVAFPSRKTHLVPKAEEEPLPLGHLTAKEHRHFIYVATSFVSSLLACETFLGQMAAVDSSSSEEGEESVPSLLRGLMEEALSLTHSSNRLAELDASRSRYWRALSQRALDAVEATQALLPDAASFAKVAAGLLESNSAAVRRRAAETVVATLPRFQGKEEPLLELVAPLVREVGVKGVEARTVGEEEAAHKQVSLMALKVLCRATGASHPKVFLEVLDAAYRLVEARGGGSSVLLASALLCLAETVSALKAHVVPSLPRFMPPLLAAMQERQRLHSNELLQLSCATAMHKIVEHMHHFLHPHLSELVTELCCWCSSLPLEQSCQTQPRPHLELRLRALQQLLPSVIAPRLLLPAMEQAHHSLCRLPGTTAAMAALLAHLVTGAPREELEHQRTAILDLFLQLLQLRAEECEAEERSLDAEEGEVTRAFSVWVLRMSEAQFKPVYFRLLDWATAEGSPKERLITFYRLSADMAEKLQVLFVLFAPHMIPNAAEVLDANNCSKAQDPFFQGSQPKIKATLLVTYVLACLKLVFQHCAPGNPASGSLPHLITPLVDQLEGGLSLPTAEDEDLLAECLGCLGAALGSVLAPVEPASSSSTPLSSLHHQVLLKTRHQESWVRLGALSALLALCRRLGQDYLHMLPQAVPFLAEMLEDEDQHVEASCHHTLLQMEAVLGESISKYF